MTETTTLRWGVLPAARIAHQVLPGLRASERNTATAIASRSVERAAAMAAEYGIPNVHGSYDDLLADPEVDAVYIALPNGLHDEWIRRCLDAGKHVLCEKPLVPTEAEAEALYDLAEKRSLHLAEAFMYRHHPKIAELTRMVRAGELGEVHTIRAWFTFMTDDPQHDIRFLPDLAGGAFRDVGCYCVSMANLIADGEPEWISAHVVTTDRGVDERSYAQLGYPGGTVATIDCSMRSQRSVGVSVLGTEGEVHVATPWYGHEEPQHLVLRTDAGERHLTVPGDDVYRQQIEDFAAVVAGEATRVVTRAETVRTARTLERVRAAAGLAG
ncbi:MAG: hypothetical protein ABS81_01365 [Pseudonocardia sp. SCN 72-86]|nr:MAG: hypothetical protein ABS81_01365 [Pseudonocardia sp. SCN 72-86]